MNNSYRYKVYSKLLPINKRIEFNEKNIDITDKHWISEIIYDFKNETIEGIIKEQIEENGMRNITFDDEKNSIIFYNQKYLPDVDDLGECEEEVCIVFSIKGEYSKAKQEVLNDKNLKDYVDEFNSDNDISKCNEEIDF